MRGPSPGRAPQCGGEPCGAERSDECGDVRLAAQSAHRHATLTAPQRAQARWSSMSSLHPPARERTQTRVYSTKSFWARIERSHKLRRLRNFLCEARRKHPAPIGHSRCEAGGAQDQAGLGVDPVHRQPLHREEEGGISLTTNFHRLAPLSERGPIITRAMMTVLVPNLLASELRAMYHSIQRAGSPLGKDGEPRIKVARSTRKGNRP
jgi:hypothetical protein